MQQMEKDTHICYAVLRGRSNQQLFEEEARKMKLLDVTADVRQSMGVQVLAYCVLDNEVHLVLEMGQMQDADSFLTKIISEYERRCLSNTGGFSGDTVREGLAYMAPAAAKNCFRQSTVRELKDVQSAARYCMKLHLMPVREGIVANPEDYWWCSYLDYLGRNWLPVTSTWQILKEYSADLTRAVKLFKKRVQKELEKRKQGKKKE